MSNGIFGSLITLVKGGANDLGQAVVDKNAPTILQQQIREAKDALTGARNSLVQQMGERKVLANKRDAAKKQLDEYNSYMPKLVQGNDPTLLRDTATKIAALEAEISGYEQNLQKMDTNIASLEQSIKTGDTSVNALSQRLDSVKATDQVQRAQRAVDSAATGANAKVRSALDSLDRIEQRQQQSAAELEAAHEVAAAQGDGGLQKRLQEAGIVPSASGVDDIIARYTKQSQ